MSTKTAGIDPHAPYSAQEVAMFEKMRHAWIRKHNLPKDWPAGSKRKGGFQYSDPHQPAPYHEAALAHLYQHGGSWEAAVEAVTGRPYPFSTDGEDAGAEQYENDAHKPPANFAEILQYLREHPGTQYAEAAEAVATK